MKSIIVHEKLKKLEASTPNLLEISKADI